MWHGGNQSEFSLSVSCKPGSDVAWVQYSSTAASVGKKSEKCKKINKNKNNAWARTVGLRLDWTSKSH